MNRLVIIFFLIGASFFLFSCNDCESKSKTWKNEAPQILEEFKLVDVEIKKHALHLKMNKNKNSIYLDNRDTLKLEQTCGVQLPQLKKWFREHSSSPWNYISYTNENITVNIKTCKSNTIIYSAYLYYSTDGIRPSFTKNWKKQVELKDSLDLGNNWYYLLTKCDGCDN
jgi:hypothetical protein